MITPEGELTEAISDPSPADFWEVIQMSLWLRERPPLPLEWLAQPLVFTTISRLFLSYLSRTEKRADEREKRRKSRKR